MLISCSEKTQKNEISSKNVEITETTNFNEYLKSLNQIPLPFKYASSDGNEFPNISSNYDKKGFSKYKHSWTSKPLGILYKNKNYVSIIDLAIGDYSYVPFLTSYDLKGNKIDSLSVFKVSGVDFGYEAVEYLHLKPKMIFSVSDTIKRWKINKTETDVIENSLKITTKTINYKYSENGKFVKEQVNNN